MYFFRTEEDAKIFLVRYNGDYSALLTRTTIAKWKYNTNLTDQNAADLVVRHF